MATARANFNSVISADATQFHATMRRVAVTAKTVGARIGRSMTSATRAMGRVAMSAKNATLGILGIGTALSGVAIAATVKEMYDMGGSLSDLSSRTGIAVGELAVLQRAFQDNGLAAEKVGPIINKMQKGITDFGAGLSTQVRAFERLGISYEMIRDKSPVEQFDMLQTALAGIDNQSVKTATAMEIFGRAGGDLQALFDDAGAIGKASGSLGSAAGILERNAQTFDRISDLMQSAGQNLKLFALGVAEVAAPKLLAALEGFNRIDFAALGVRFARGMNVENVLKLMKLSFKVATRFLATETMRALAKALLFFGSEWDKFISIKTEGLANALKEALKAALNPLFAIEGLKKLNEAREAEGKKFAENMLAILDGEDPFGVGDATDDLKSFFKDMFGGKVDAQAAPGAAGPDGDFAGTAGEVAMRIAEEGFKGLADLELMQVERNYGIGPGTNTLLTKGPQAWQGKVGAINRSGKSTIGSIESTGGLGAKRRVGRGKSEEELKRQTELAKTSEEHLMDIKERLGKALSVSQ